MSEIETLKQIVVYENEFVTVFDDVVKFPSGKNGTYFRYRWKAPHGVAIVPIHGCDVILIQNYRYAEKSLSIEVPQGFGCFGRTPQEDASRELFEETGLTAQKFEQLLVLGADFKTFVFVAEIDDLAQVSNQNAEVSESISSYRRIPIEKISHLDFGAAGIFDPVTIAALLALRSIRT
ncbi:NUDIX hydrolase [Agrobacterium sp. RAC06]|uniref:NUDIX hydrolase n=1 Tax=Agrobacterium sp. RAC06 TaxID=1842536 RepID=UPI0012378505|nr:NUDIX hydrolase [Agrobacterium sp. RAC06]